MSDRMVQIQKRAYRPDIDGLRAVAVLAVMLYHSGNTPFTGGYIGVDVFFVISGFLISGLIVNDIQSNKFSLLTFYERRIRRIFPAYFTVAIAVGLAGSWLYDAKTFTELWYSIAAATVSMANILFYSQAGYFDGPSLLKPMLHTWSLSVEEQFYLFLPLIFFLIFKYSRRWLIPILIFLLLGSLGWSIYTVETSRDAAFYMAYLRAWELLVGGLIVLRPVRLKPWIQNLLAGIGLLVLGVCMLVYSDATLFPGLTAVAPVLGTALIINSGIHENTLVGKFLSLPPMVFIGKISYSLYLWHWPVLIMIRYYLISDMTRKYYLAWWVLTFVLSALSWKFIETPFRDKNFLPRPRIFNISAAIAVLILVSAFVIVQSEGLPIRIDLKTSLPPDVWNSQFMQWQECQNSNNVSDEDCRIGIKAEKQTFLVWGNSHAHAFAPGFNQAAINTKKSGIILWKGGCPPLLGLGEKVDTGCNEFNNDVMAIIKDNPDIQTVILAASWSPGVLSEANMKQTIEELRSSGKKIFIVLPFPDVNFNVSAAYFIASRTGRDANAIIAPTLKEFMNPKNKKIFELLRAGAANYEDVYVIDITDVFCDNERCKVIENNKPLYVDKGHLSSTGALLLTPKFEEIFR